MPAVCGACQQAFGKWLKRMAGLQDRLAILLGEISYRSAKRPWATIGLCLLLSIGCGAGFLRLEMENDAPRLWTDQNSNAMKSRDYVDEVYGPSPVIMRVLIQAKNKVENALTVDVFRDAFEMADLIQAQKTDDGKTYADICEASPFLGCTTGGALRFFYSNRTVFESEVTSQADLSSKVSALTYPDDGGRVIRDQVFGQWTVVGDQIAAPVWRMDFFLRSGLDEDVAMDWEKKVLDAFVGSESFVAEQRWEHAHVEIWSTGRSLDDELARVVGGDTLFMGIAYLFLILACALMLGPPHHCVSGRKVLGALDFFVVALSALAGYGLSAALGVQFTSLQQVLPFILVGIGVDDAYVLTGAFDRADPSQPVPERIREAMRLEGMSVTLTSVTDMIAFFCGATAAFPAVRSFCIYAGLSVFFVYFFHLTAFAALLALDAQRQEAKRYDVLCCFKSSRMEASNSDLAERLMVKYTKLITFNVFVKLAILATFFAFTGICVWQAVDKIDTRLEVLHLAPDESYMRDFVETEIEYWGTDSGALNIPVFLFYRDLDVSSAEVQARMRAAEDDFLELTSINQEHGIESWHRSFTQWAADKEGQHQLLLPENYAMVDGVKYFTGPDFYAAVQAWVTDCDLGCSFEDDIIFESSPLRIRDSRVQAIQVSNGDTDWLGAALTETEEFSEEKDGVLPGIFIFTENYIFYDQYNIIRSELYQTTGMCFLAVLVVSFAIISHPLAVFIVLGVVFLVFVDLLGCLPIAGVSLNSISMINLVMAIGFVVDYNMHIAHGFMAQDPSLSRDERTVRAMQSIGLSVAKGVFSTLIAILPMYFATSEIFRIFFKMLLAILIVGGGHGLMFMPVLLSLIGPKGTEASAGHKMEIPDEGRPKEPDSPTVSAAVPVEES